MTVAASPSAGAALPARRPRRRVGPARPSSPARSPAPAVPAWWRAIPDGSAPARSQAGWLRAALTAIDEANLRIDADRALRTLVWQLARWADWQTPLLSRPTWPVLAARTGRSRRWVASRLAWLRRRGLLGVAETGSTPATRPMPLADLEGNRAAVYLLTIPAPPPASPPPVEPTTRREITGPAPDKISSGRAVDATCTPPSSQRELENTPRARETHRPDRSLREPGNQPNPPRRLAPAPGTRRHARQQAADQLQHRAPITCQLTTAHLAALLHDFLTAGWTVPDLHYALDHSPTGAPHWHTTTIRRPAGWLRSRLDLWRTTTGRPGPSRSAQLAANAAAARAQLAAARHHHSAARANAATPTQRRTHLTAIRTSLARPRQAP